jgi:Spy/CpxP family protein refolding chaperone
VSAVTAGPTPATGLPRRRLLLALLVVSVALNLFFVAGAAWTRWNGSDQLPSPARRFQQMAAQLDLDPQQQIAFRAYAAAMRAGTEKMHEQVAPLVNGAWEEIAKPHADPAQVTRLFDEAAEKRREFQREATAQTLDLLGNLTPAQRSKFVEIVRERRPLWMRARAAQH